VPITRLASICLLSICFLADAAQAAESPPIATTCTTCHGARGEGSEAVAAPALAGQHAAYLARQLANFRAGRRGYDPADTGGITMRSIAATLSDADIQSLAEHYGSLAAVDRGQSTRPEGDPEAGTVLYRGSCAACHGLHAQGFPQLNIPNLRILQGWYLSRQMRNFQEGRRGAASHADQPGVWMRSVANHVDQHRELDDVVAYIDGLSATATR
jgi:cytochrome c553